MTADTKTREELAQTALDRANDILDRVENMAEAMGIDFSAAVGDGASEAVAQDIESASGGVLQADAYLGSKPAPVYTSTDSVFQARFDETRNQLLIEAGADVNVFTRQTLTKLIELMTDLDAMILEIGAEAQKIKLSSIAGLLAPPSRADVQELRDSTQGAYDRTVESVENLETAQARRISAKQQLSDYDELAKDEIIDEVGIVDNRYLRPMAGAQKQDRSDPTDVEDAYFAASKTNRALLEKQAQATGRVDARLPESTTSLYDTALGKVGFIAICMAIASLDRQQSVKTRALSLYERIKGAVDQLMSSLEAGFLASIQGQMQESATATLNDIADTLQDKLDSLDTWLGLSFPELPTFVSLVESIGDRASDTPILESLAGFCDLNLTSFCDFQQLMEAAKTLDAQICNFTERDRTLLGRVRLIIEASDEGHRTAVDDLPDQETSMFLVQVSGLDVVARVPRPLRLSRSSGSTTENFENDFAPSPNIRGGEGTLELRGDGEVLERLNYDSSSFDPGTGYHTFRLTSAPLKEHTFQVLGRPTTRGAETLFKGADLRTPAQRFNIAGSAIRHPDYPTAFDFTSSISSVTDYYGTGKYRLKIGRLPHPFALDPLSTQLSGVGSQLAIETPYYGEETESQVLSRVYAQEPAGSSRVLARLNSRLLTDLLVSGGSSTISGRVTVDVATNNVVGRTSVIDNSTPYPNQRLIVVEDMIHGDEAGMRITIQGEVTQIEGQIVSASANAISFVADNLTGQATISGTTVTGTGTKFLDELNVGDYITFLIGTFHLWKKVTAINSQTELEIDTSDTLGTLTSMALYAKTGLVTKTVSIARASQETLEFSGITQVEDDIYALDLATGVTTAYAHQVQELELKPTVRIVSTSVEQYRANFATIADNVKSRQTPEIVPAGSTKIVASFETLALQPLYGGLVENATEVLYNDQPIAISPPASVDGDTYTFSVDGQTAWPMTAGDIIEVETTNIFDDLEVNFNTTWSTEIDDWFRGLGEKIDELFAKLCRLVSGRPMDLGLTAQEIKDLTEFMHLKIQLLMLPLQAMILGISESTVISNSIETFRESGMDAAAVVVENGDVQGLSTMRADTATSEGAARKSIEDYDAHLVLYSDSRIGEELKALLTAAEYDKKLLAQARSDFEDLVRARVDRYRKAANVIRDKANQITKSSGAT